MPRLLGSITEDRLGTVSMTQNTSSCGALISSNEHVSYIFHIIYITLVHIRIYRFSKSKVTITG